MAAFLSSELVARAVEHYLGALSRAAGGCAAGAAGSVDPVANPAATAEAGSLAALLFRLDMLELLQRDEAGGVTLTPAGRRAALRAVQRHRLVERYLVALLSGGAVAAEAKAGRLSYAGIRRLGEWLVRAIESENQGVQLTTWAGGEQVSVPLPALPAGVVGTVRWIDTDEPDVLHDLEARGVIPGARVMILGAEPAGEVITIRVGSKRHVIAYEHGCLVLCE